MAQGYDPVNPFKNGLPDEAHWRVHMRADIALLLACDYIYMLKGVGPHKRSAAGQQTSGIVRVLLPGNGRYARAICKPMPGRLLNVLR